MLNSVETELAVLESETNNLTRQANSSVFPNLDVIRALVNKYRHMYTVAWTSRNFWFRSCNAQRKAVCAMIDMFNGLETTDAEAWQFQTIIDEYDADLRKVENGQP